jgi:ribosomal protein S18 acetylase RimI-like enzyme
VTWAIHEPAIADADEMGWVHVTVWQQAYAGLMPADYLDSLDPEAFAEGWRERLTKPPLEVRTWIARDEDGICALTTSGPARDADAPEDWQLYAINVLARAQGTGVADALVDGAIGDRAAYLWVVDGNERAQAFYRRHRFRDDGGRTELAPTGTLEVRMSRGHLER